MYIRAGPLFGYCRRDGGPFGGGAFSGTSHEFPCLATTEFPCTAPYPLATNAACTDSALKILLPDIMGRKSATNARMLVLLAMLAPGTKGGFACNAGGVLNAGGDLHVVVVMGMPRGGKTFPAA